MAHQLLSYTQKRVTGHGCTKEENTLCDRFFTARHI